MKSASEKGQVSLDRSHVIAFQLLLEGWAQAESVTGVMLCQHESQGVAKSSTFLFMLVEPCPLVCFIQPFTRSCEERKWRIPEPWKSVKNSFFKR